MRADGQFEWDGNAHTSHPPQILHPLGTPLFTAEILDSSEINSGDATFDSTFKIVAAISS